MIELHEIDGQYVLTIPFEQKDRAKGIEGRKWDPGRKAWVYPRTKRVREALIAEFGEELLVPGSAVPTAPSGPVATQAGRRVTVRDVENEGLSAPGKDPQLSGLQETLRALDTARLEIERLELELTSARRRLEERDAIVSSLRQQLVSSTPSSWQPPSRDDFPHLAREEAILATGRDRVFAHLLKDVDIDKWLPLKLVKDMEQAFRILTGIVDRGVKLHELINEARRGEHLAPEMIDLAHTIRRQRNILTHEEVDSRTVPGRVYLALFAAAILWPHLPEVGS